jgi:uncharacterized protein with GYD domain
MAKFMATITFTDRGIKTIGDTTRRAASFKVAAKKMGVKVTDVYWCLGRFDGLLLFEAPDSQVAIAAMLHLAALGNVKTQTAQAFAAAEMEKVLAAVPGPQTGS